MNVHDIKPRRAPKNGDHFVALAVCGNPDFTDILYRDLLKIGIEMRHVWTTNFDRLPIDRRQAPIDIDFGFTIKDNILSSKQRDAAQFKIRHGSRAIPFELPPNNKLIAEALVQQGFFGKALTDEKYRPPTAPIPGEAAKAIAPPSDTGTPKPEKITPEPASLAPVSTVAVTKADSADTTVTKADTIETEDQIPPDLRRLTPEQRQSLREGAVKMKAAREALGISQVYFGRIIDPTTSGTLISQIERPTIIPSNEVCEAIDIILKREQGTFPRLAVKHYSRLNLDVIRKRAAAMHDALANRQPLPSFRDEPRTAAPREAAAQPRVVYAAGGTLYHHPLLAAPYRSAFAPVAVPDSFQPAASTTMGVSRLSLDERKRLYSIGRGLGQVRTSELQLTLAQAWALIDPSGDNKSGMSSMENGAHRFMPDRCAALEMLYGVPAGTISPSETAHQSLHGFDLETARMRIAEWQIARGLAEPASAAKHETPPASTVAVGPPPPAPAPPPSPSLPIIPVTLPAAVAVAAPVNDNASPTAVKPFFANPPPADASLVEKQDWFDSVLRRLRHYMPEVGYVRVEITPKQTFCDATEAKTA